jgi:hypothetical protein
LLDGERDSWLALEAALLADGHSSSSPGAIHPRTQLYYGLSLDLYESRLDIFLQGYHLELGAKTGISMDSMTVHLRPYCELRNCFLVSLAEPKPDLNENLDLSCLEPAFGSGDSTSSAESLRQISQWLSVCRRTHPKCGMGHRKDSIPSRLLYVGGAANEELPRLRLRSSIPPDSVYATLSHCWGDKSTLKLTQLQFDDFLRGVPLVDFPATYRDAIFVVRSLGLEYIWIDSLCIIQDSSEDWQRECSSMAEVYKNGVLNIAALCAKDNSDGCFFVRDAHLFKPLVLRSNWSNFETDMWAWEPFLKSDFNAALLHSRAWVLQERVLSPRVVHFGKTMVFWECRQQTSAELVTDFTIQSIQIYEESRIKKAEDVFAKDGIIEQWVRLVEEYSGRLLTQSEDRLVAFSGIAKIVQRILESSTGKSWEYVAGLWRPLLPWALLWTPAYNATPRRPTHYRAPSWSWASVDSEVDFHLEPHYAQYASFVSVLDCRIFPLEDDPFLQVVDGYLRLRCLLFRLDQTYPDETDDDLVQSRVFSWDIEDFAEDPDTYIYLIPIIMVFITYVNDDNTYAMLHGIMVQPVGTRFQRRGKFRISFRKDKEDFHGLDERDHMPWFRIIMEILHERGVVSSYAFKGPFPVINDDEDRRFLWATQDVLLI